MKRHTLLRASLLVAALAVSACDDNSNSNTSKGQGISGLTESPKTTLGKSAAAGRDAGRKIVAADAATGGMADEISGNVTPLTVAGLVFPVNNNWQAQAASGMRAADYVVPGDGGDDARVLFFHFEPGQGGSVDSNLSRYQSMMHDTAGNPADLNKKVQQIAGCRVTLGSMEGTYQDSMGNPGGDKVARLDYAMKVAVIEGPKGNIFIRFVGPRTLIEQRTGEWDSMTLGMRRE